MKSFQTPIPRNEKFILDEYEAAGLRPVLLDDGRPVSLELARQMGLTIAPMPKAKP